MEQSYEQAIEWIHSRMTFGIKPGLKRMEWLMDRLGNPHQNIRAIHVAGTNGKGSTVTYMRHILQEMGYRIGTFTSPYIVTFNERISVNGFPISNEEMVQLIEIMQPLAYELEQTDLGPPTEFEIITAMSFLYFGKLNPQDYCIYEVGLGGRLDSTNVLTPILSLITTIGMDHTAILGNTIGEIAWEKAGIIKPNVPIITTVKDSKALEVIRRRAMELNSRIIEVPLEKISVIKSKEPGEFFLVQEAPYEDIMLKINMLGTHQIQNATLALFAMKEMSFLTGRKPNIFAIKTGLEKAFWPGRLEILNLESTVILDGAHNLQGVDKLVETLMRHYQDQSIHILFSAVEDKDYMQMIEKLKSITKHVNLTTFSFYRSIPISKSKEIGNQLGVTVVESWLDFIEEYLHNAREQQLLVVTGSLYFISDVRQYLIKRPMNEVEEEENNENL